MAACGAGEAGVRVPSTRPLSALPLPGWGSQKSVLFRVLGYDDSVVGVESRDHVFSYMVGEDMASQESR